MQFLISPLAQGEMICLFFRCRCRLQGRIKWIHFEGIGVEARRRVV
nr:MAG TPA: hypothetical protein [Caudoviricetes sp.]